MKSGDGEDEMEWSFQHIWFGSLIGIQHILSISSSSSSGAF